MDDESEDQSAEHHFAQFAEIVNTSLANVGRPARLRVLDWTVWLGMMLSIVSAVGILVGTCIFIWQLVLN